MRRRAMIAASAALLLGVAGIALWLRAEQVTLKNYDRITVGMGLSEVEEILGPSRDERTAKTAEYFGPAGWVEAPPLGLPHFGQKTGEIAYWSTDEVMIAIYLEDLSNPRVGKKWYIPLRMAELGPRDKVRSWAKRLSQKWLCRAVRA
jgi:hypothetical protein